MGNKKNKHFLEDKNDFLVLKKALDSYTGLFSITDVKNYYLTYSNNLSFEKKLSKELCNEGENKSGLHLFCTSQDCPINIIKKTRKPAVLGYSLKKVNGKNIDLEIHAYPIFDKKNKLTHVVKFSIDSTDKKLAELSSRERKDEMDCLIKLNNEILENSPVGIFIIEKSGFTSYFNKTMLEISGANYDNFKKVNFLKHPQYKSIGLIEKIEKCFNGDRFVLENIKYTSLVGNKYTIRNFIGIPLNIKNENKVLMIVEDITKLKENELRKQNTATEWSETFDSMSDGISIHSPEHTITHVNKTICDLFGLSREEMVGKKCYKIFHKKNRYIKDCPLKRSVVSRDKEHLEYYEETLGKWLRVSVSPILSYDGGVRKVVHIVTDITERKETEENLKKRNKELELFNNLAVDRELKMIELKKEINKLKSKLK